MIGSICVDRQTAITDRQIERDTTDNTKVTDMTGQNIETAGVSQASECKRKFTVEKGVKKSFVTKVYWNVCFMTGIVYQISH